MEFELFDTCFSCEKKIGPEYMLLDDIVRLNYRRNTLLFHPGCFLNAAGKEYESKLGINLEKDPVVIGVDPAVPGKDETVYIPHKNEKYKFEHVGPGAFRITAVGT